MPTPEPATGRPASEVIRELLTGELAAVETYEAALDRFVEEAIVARLRGIHADHVHAVYTLRQRLEIYTDQDVTSSGAWGAFATSLENAANLIADGLALRVLQEGEGHGIRRYELALEEPAVDAATKLLVREQLLPKCRDHAEALVRLRQ